MRFVRYTSTEWKDIYFLTYEDSIEANLLQMVLAKERINLFMKGADADLDEVYKKFGVDYNLQAQLLSREAGADGRMRIRWGAAANCLSAFYNTGIQKCAVLKRGLHISYISVPE